MLDMLHSTIHLCVYLPLWRCLKNIFWHFCCSLEIFAAKKLLKAMNFNFLIPYDRKKITEHLRMLHRVFVQCWHTCQLMFFWKILWIGFSRSLKAIQRWWARFRLSFVVVNIKKIIFFIKLRLHKGRCSPVII